MLKEMGMRAKEAAASLSMLSNDEKNNLLDKIAINLKKNEDAIIEQNSIDVEAGRLNGLAEGLIDRLKLTSNRIDSMIEGIRTIIALEDPVGEVLGMKTMKNGLIIGKKRVPLGVVGIIYEARPNVTVDTAALCLKSSNALILRGGKEALNSNKALAGIMRQSIEEAGYNKDFVQLIEDQSYEVANEFMKLNDYLDVLIPRGSDRLIKSVVQNSTVPVIETGTGNCHIYVDASADEKMAVDIIINAKTQRIGVCNSAESLVVHSDKIEGFLPLVWNELKKYNVTVYADERAKAVVPEFQSATEEDFATEYLDYKISLKVVDSLDEAIRHINKYSTSHSESIVTENYANAMEFLNRVDSAAVYVNASTRFTDGFEFGMGGEMGISTQKLHVRGPVGTKELTTTKYIIFGNGQIRG
ncbi:glutamate-5-semialdehyde dehydrogenase [Youngiibacter multivorans]|uniref:Gamma-glutamyl phosphate reductase n=1 Tax=Youngiibacter multivorans TaxID=937251 RepID=A0ABS4G4Y1_9CLOT|nr:glutamate-5-semialdehyde dehydrogenase [Youngiibacter multivorans]MBP1919618.1 glutamate-5-semialdehyde dehydrogenase [Youngiibacter multivorans]